MESNYTSLTNKEEGKRKLKTKELPSLVRNISFLQPLMKSPWTKADWNASL